MSYGQYPTSKLISRKYFPGALHWKETHLRPASSGSSYQRMKKRAVFKRQCFFFIYLFYFIYYYFLPPLFFFLQFGTKAKHISGGSSVEGAHSWTNTLPFTARSVSHTEHTAAHGAISWATFLRPCVCSLLVAALQVIPKHSALCLNLRKILLECTTSVWSYLPQARIGHPHQPLASQEVGFSPLSPPV